VGDDAFGGELAFGDPVDDRLEAVGAEVGTEQVEFFAVADDAPVDGRRRTEDREFNKAAELADGRQALDDAGGMASCFDIDVAAVTVGHIHHRLDRIGLARVDHHVGAEFFRQFEAVVLHVHDHELFRIFHAQVGDHAQPEGAGAGDDHDIFIADAAAIDGMLGAGIGFDQGCLFDRQGLVDFVDQGALGQLHVLSHATIDFLLEAIDVMFLAHPVVAVFAEFALPARDDLVRDDTVTDRDVALEIGSDGDDFAEKFMARDEGGADPGRLDFVAPEHGRTMVGFGVACANAAGFDFDQDIAFTELRHRVCGFQLVFGLAVCNKGFHGFWNRHGGVLL